MDCQSHLNPPPDICLLIGVAGMLSCRFVNSHANDSWDCHFV